MAGAEARHFQRIADAAAGFARQVLQRAVHVVVGDHDRVALTQQAAQPVGGLALLVGALRRGHAGQAWPTPQAPAEVGWSNATDLMDMAVSGSGMGSGKLYSY